MEWEDVIVVQMGAMRDARSKEHQGDTRYVDDCLKVKIYHYILSSHAIIAVKCSSDQLSRSIQLSSSAQLSSTAK